MRNILVEDFLIEPSIELLPRISISPFKEIRAIESDSSAEDSEKYFKNRFGFYKIFPKARNAIYAALNSFCLNSDDVVTIFTTSGNFYISSCVTKEIEKICNWSREITDKTKVIFINHEFGYPMSESDYEGILRIKKDNSNLKIVEDCAHTFFSQSTVIGSIADYVIYSLPKSFSMQIGALLVSKNEISDMCFCDFKYDSRYRKYILEKFATFIPKIEKYKKQQIGNYEYLKRNLNVLGVSPYFDNVKIGIDNVVPNVFLFKWKNEIDYPRLKTFMQNNGVESSVFYDKNAFFIPCNYNLAKDELDYMITLLTYFKETMVDNICID